MSGLDTNRALRRTSGRRAVLRAGALGAAGLAGAALLGCGGDDEAPAASAPAGGAGQLVSTTAKRPDTLPAGWYWAEGNPFPYQYGEPAGKQPKRGGTFVDGVTWDVGPLDPIKSSAGGSITIPNYVYNRLIGYAAGPGVDPFALKLEAELAKTWEQTPDGLTYTFKLSPGVKWQNLPPLNGRDFVAADVKFAFERYRKEGLYQSYWKNVASIDAVDPATLKITLSKPAVDFLIPLGSRYQTIFPHELVDAGTIDKAVIGTGPMILKEAVAGAQVKLERNPTYFEREVLLDGVECRIIPDPAARLAAFRVGQVDHPLSSFENLKAIRAVIESNPTIQVNMLAPTSSSGAVPLLNLQNAKWQDVRVRRALSLAINRKLINETLFEGLGYSYPTIPWPFVLDTAPTIENGAMGKWVRYAPDEAKQLLQAAGATSLSVDAPYYEYGASFSQRADLLVDHLRQVGITYRAQKMDYTEYNSQLQTGKFPDALSWGYLPLGHEADTYFYNQIHSKSPGNRDHVNDAEIDGWSEAQQVELNPKTRRELHKKIWDKSLDQAYRPVSTNATSFEAFQPWVRGLRSGHAYGSGSSFYDFGNQIAGVWIDK